MGSAQKHSTSCQEKAVGCVKVMAGRECSNCGRRGGAPADGATINTGGCTGACLRWAVRLVQHCLSLSQFSQCNPWEHWSADYRDAVAFRLITKGISDLGLGYLHWIETHSCAGLQEMCDRFASFVPSARLLPATGFDDVKEAYEALITLHDRCVQLPRKVYELSLHSAANDSWRVVLSCMNGEPVGECILPCSGPLNPWQLAPQSSLRIAADGNVYTLQDFVAYYGEEISHCLWARAAPCYDHGIDFLHENGDRIEGRTCQYWFVSTTRAHSPFP